jgi:general secretion pathway protein K
MAVVTGRPGERGFALVFVLTIAAILGAVTSSALQASMSGARAAALFSDIAQADELGRAAAEITGAYIGEDPRRQRAGAFALRLAHARLRVDYVNEAARIDVNLAPPRLIAALAAAMGGDDALVAALPARIDRFRKAQAGASAPGADAPRLRDAEDAPAAFGIPARLARRMLPQLTVANGTATIDPLLADRSLIAALFLGAADRLDDFLDKRQAGFATKEVVTLLFPAESRDLLGFEPSPAVRAIATVSLENGFERRYEAVLSAGGEQVSPARVHAWRPLFPETQ